MTEAGPRNARSGNKEILYFSKGADSAKWSLVFGLILLYSYKQET